MSRGTLDSLHAIESCAFQLLSWRPFARNLDSDSPKHYAANHGPYSKRPCRADRATSSFSIDAILDMSKLSLFDDDRPLSLSAARKRWFARKRRRRGGSRSVSGRSSDRRCCSVGASAANGTCSDFPMVAGGTDSSGELFGDPNWASDVSDRNSRREREGSGGGEREHVSAGCGGQFGNCDSQGNESGYGSEPGYRGDAELGYDDEEEDDPRVLFWGDEFGENTSKLERMGENSLQKAHHRGRRKKHDLRSENC
ncbi:uncharacterized protein LOC105163129 [Sesamum indicum]|uniref:Uncharacterized protein LOC105163129 n=1 Tax=Sesamum indicum TaxID=4182 RepID=A0A8M8UVD8_SESIN|nr:uncharacterized protein LOC105163129 [Sesamum indicum]